MQLSAIDHDKADIMVELLRKKKFSAIAAEIPEKPGIFRVLVGPISDADINKTRADSAKRELPRQGRREANVLAAEPELAWTR